MKEPKLQKKPEYRLLKQSDAVSFFHMQMPRWLFCDPKYKPLSLEAKVTYTFLLNRFQLSKMNGWQNSDGEVFIIFPREKLAEEAGISYRKAIACFKELLAANLIWEQRVGRGSANRIYMAAVDLSEENAAKHDSAPFGSRSAEPAGLDGDAGHGETAMEPDADAGTPKQAIPEPQVLKCRDGTSAYADPALPDMPFSHSNKKEVSKKEWSDTEVSPSCHARAHTRGRDRPADAERDGDMLADILKGCELEVLPEDEAGVFRNAVTRLFYSESFRVGSAVLPRPVIRSHLNSLDGTVLLDTREKLRQNRSKQVKNSTAYVMAALLNNIWECKSDLMVDPYLNALGAS